MEITLSKTLPAYPSFVEGIRRAPDRGYTLTPAKKLLSVKGELVIGHEVRSFKAEGDSADY